MKTQDLSTTIITKKPKIIPNCERSVSEAPDNTGASGATVTMGQNQLYVRQGAGNFGSPEGPGEDEKGKRQQNRGKNQQGDNGGP